MLVVVVIMMNMVMFMSTYSTLTSSKVTGKGRMATVMAMGSHQEPLLASARERLMEGNTMKNMVKPADTFEVESDE